VSYRVLILPRAEADEAEILDYLAERSLRVAQRFLDCVEQTLDREALMPTPGMPWNSPDSELRELRWKRVTGFPNYLLFFRLSDGKLEVVRVLHGARDLEQLLVE
jgi:toxin ParE1/3/4